MRRGGETDQRKRSQRLRNAVGGDVVSLSSEPRPLIPSRRSLSSARPVSALALASALARDSSASVATVATMGERRKTPVVVS